MAMSERRIREMVAEAVRTNNKDLLNSVAAQLAASERAHEMLRAKGYGDSGMQIDLTVRQVPQKNES